MRLSPPLSRVAALMLLVMLCWALAMLVAAPVLDMIARAHESAAHSRILLARYGQLQASVPALERQIAVLRASAGQKAFLPDREPGLRAAEMQSTAQKLAAAAGATLRSSRTLAPAAEERFSSQGVELELTASMAALTALLHAVESAEPLIIVDRLAVQVPENGAGAKSADGQPLLNVTLRLLSYGRAAVRDAAVRDGV